MTAWQRTLRVGLAIFIAALTVTLIVSLRRPRPPAAPAALPPGSEPNVVAESTSGRSLRVLEGKPDISVEHYDKLVQYADGRTRFTGVRFAVLQRRGRDFTVTSATADLVGEQPNVDIVLKGSVKITSTDGLDLRTEEATYSNAQGVVRAPGAVEFTRPGLRGTAVGMTYDKNRDLLALLARVVLHADPGAKGEGPLDIRAGAASLARPEKTMRFERGVQLVREGETLAADDLTAYLTEDGKQVQRLELRGSSRVDGAPKSDGGLKAMRARDIDLAYAADGRTLQHALLNGDAHVELAGAAGSEGRLLSGQSIEIGLAPDGATLTLLAASGQVDLELSRDATTPARSIRSSALQAGGAPGGGLTSAVFSGGVDFRESPPAPAAARHATSSTLALALEGGFGKIASARFGGGVRFAERSLTAMARDADYGIAAGTLHLSGHDGKANRAPFVVDERATIEGERIDVQLAGRKIAATSSVKSETRGAAGDAGQGHMPAMLDAGKPVHATADHLAYDSEAALATYTGSAGLWQDNVSIRADTIVLDSQKGNLAAHGRVVSNMAFEQVNSKTKATEQVRSVATAPEMAYQDASRSVTYTGGAHLNGQLGDLSADRIVLLLEEGARKLNRLEADGPVTLRTPEGRKAVGKHLVYLAATEQYDMLGTPVVLNDEYGETTGNSLTFFRSVDRIVVDGIEQRRTQLKRDIKR